jgi:hypothetical protein
MPTINQLAAVDDLSGGDSFPIYAASQGDARKVSLTTLLSYIAANMDALEVNSVTAALFAKVDAVPVAELSPLATAGARATVNNATQTLTAGIGAVVAGGGANVVPVFFDGTNWRIG